jgi:putative Mg2+ transporter-C (MgtC) family protein
VDSIQAPADLQAIVVRLTLATVMGAAVGLNRELVLKPAGLRTHALVSLGAALTMIVGLTLIDDVSASSRVIQGIVAGVGFIGGGVILHLRDERTVQGLTTAASIWVVAATGVAAGAGLWRAALITVVLALIVLTGGRALERALHHDGG